MSQVQELSNEEQMQFSKAAEKTQEQRGLSTPDDYVAATPFVSMKEPTLEEVWDGTMRELTTEAPELAASAAIGGVIGGMAGGGVGGFIGSKVGMGLYGGYQLMDNLLSGNRDFWEEQQKVHDILEYDPTDDFGDEFRRGMGSSFTMGFGVKQQSNSTAETLGYIAGAISRDFAIAGTKMPLPAFAPITSVTEGTTRYNELEARVGQKEAAKQAVAYGLGVGGGMAVSMGVMPYIGRVASRVVPEAATGVAKLGGSAVSWGSWAMADQEIQSQVLSVTNAEKQKDPIDMQAAGALGLFGAGLHIGGSAVGKLTKAVTNAAYKTATLGLSIPQGVASQVKKTRTKSALYKRMTQRIAKDDGYISTMLQRAARHRQQFNPDNMPSYLELTKSFIERNPAYNSHKEQQLVHAFFRGSI